MQRKPFYSKVIIHPKPLPGPIQPHQMTLLGRGSQGISKPRLIPFSNSGAHRPMKSHPSPIPPPSLPMHPITLTPSHPHPSPAPPPDSGTPDNYAQPHAQKHHTQCKTPAHTSRTHTSHSHSHCSPPPPPSSSHSCPLRKTHAPLSACRAASSLP